MGRPLLPHTLALGVACGRGLFLIPRPDPGLNGDRQAQLLCPFWAFCHNYHDDLRRYLRVRKNDLVCMVRITG